MDFSRLDKLLRERKISRRKLAHETGINENTIGTAFKRKSGLSSDDVFRIAKYLGVSPYYLEGWTVKLPDGVDETEDAQAEFFKDGKYMGSMWVNPSGTPTHDAINEFMWLQLEGELQRQGSIQHVIDMGISEQLINAALKLNKAGQKKVTDYAEDLSENPKYTTPERD